MQHIRTSILALAFLGSWGTAVANDELLIMQEIPANWAMPTGDYANWRYSELAQINKDNVGDLQPAWTFSTGVLRGHEGGPLVIGDVMYIHTPFPNIVYALDLNDEGRVIWKYEPKQDPAVISVMCCDTVNRGVAYGNGKIFLYQADTTLVALDARTGEVVWQVQNGDPSIAETGTSAPMVYEDLVFVGISGGEFGVRGSLTAYNTETGDLVWRAYSTGPDSDTLMDPEKTTHLGRPVGPDTGTATWEGDQWQIGGGATSGWYSIDPELNLIYYGTGSPGTWNPVQRPGDNRWAGSIFARDVDTGMAKWVYQMTPHDEWAYDGISENILVDLEIDGQMRKALVHFDRNGFAYTLDRQTGELLVAEKYDPAVNWATHVDMETGRPQVVPRYSTDHSGEDVNTTNICPAALGTKNQQPAAYSKQTGLFYVPTSHVCMDYEPFQVSYTAGQAYVGATISMYPAPGGSDLGNFIAWDAATGEIVWSNPEPFSVGSGALATAGDVVFYGTLEGYLKAVDANTGEELYRFKTPSGIVGNVNTWMHKGKQYIGVLSGVGGWAGIGLAAGLIQEESAAGWHGAVHPGRESGTGVDTAGLGAVGAYKSLSNYTQLGGQFTVFTLSPGGTPIARATRGSQRAQAGQDTSLTLVKAFFGTNRENAGTLLKPSFNNGRSRQLSLGTAYVTIPKNHETGTVQRPRQYDIAVIDWLLGEDENPYEHFTMYKLEMNNLDIFISNVKSTISSATKYKDQALVFIHGYNVTFDAAAFRTAQIVYDLGFDGAAFFYSWPSDGGVTYYEYDQQSAAQSIPYLLDFLQLVKQESGADLIHIIAHSMGSLPLMEALGDLQQELDSSEGDPVFSEVILAAPDIDVDLFYELADRIHGVARGFTLYASSEDRAMKAARDYARGVERAGDIGERGPIVVEGIETIDVSVVGTSFFGLNHSTYASARTLLDDIGRLLLFGTHPPDLRTPTLDRIDLEAGTYWRYPR